MAVLATDDINRANSADLGANWTPVGSTSALSISSNAILANGSGDSGEVYVGITWPNNQYAQCKLTTLTASKYNGGPIVRGLTSAQTMYCFYSTQDGSAATAEAFAVSAGSWTSLGTRTANFANGDIAYLEVQGSGTNTLKMKKNGVQVGADFTDSSIPSGNAGVLGGFDVPNTVIDDFEGGDFSGGGSIQPPRTMHQARLRSVA